MNKDMLEVYEAGSELAVSKGGITGIVEKSVVGANKAISYQLICYFGAERMQMHYNDYELVPIEGRVKKVALGFCQTVTVEKKEVTIVLDKDGKFVDLIAPEEVIIGEAILDDEQLKEYLETKEDESDETEETTTEVEEEEKA